MAIEFIYFDLGMVLIRFSVDRMVAQVAEAAGIERDRTRDILFGAGLHHDYELGRLSSHEYYEAFCEAAGRRPARERLLLAASDIFELNWSMAAVVGRIQAAGYATGILSNTCEAHWEYCRQRYAMLRGGFRHVALSYELHACKPDAAIFEAAARLAGVAPERIFFTDDIAGHVAGARSAGFDAVQYETTPQLVAELRRRGVRMNY